MKKHPNIFITSVLVVCSVLLVSVVISVTMGNSSPEAPPPGAESSAAAPAASLSNEPENQSVAEASEFVAASEAPTPEAAPQRGGRGGTSGEQRQRGRGTGEDTTGNTEMQRQGMGRFQNILNDPNVMQRIQQFTGQPGGQLNMDAIQGTLGGQGRGGRGQPGTDTSAQVTLTRGAPDPNDPLVAINLPNVQMQTIVERLSQWTGKAIVPNVDALDVRITIYAAERVPRSEALNLIYAALRTRGIIAEETDKAIYLLSTADAKNIPVATVAANEPLALLADKDQIVQKFFQVSYYMPSQIQQVILEMVNDYGYVAADDTNRVLIVIDTVRNLQRIERTLKILDVPAGSAQMVTRSIAVRYGDPAEIVQLIQMLLSAQGVGAAGSSSSSNQNQQRGGRGRGGTTTTSVVISPFQTTSGSSSNRNTRGNQSTTNLVGASNIPIVLIPEPVSNQIIARGHPDDLDQIEQWVRQFDQPGMAEADPDYTTIKVTYVNVLELAEQISETISQMPGSAITTSIRVLPLVQSNTLLVFGSQEARELIQKLVLEIDIPADKFVVEHFKLTHADPVEISYYLLDLYMGQGATGASNLLGSLSTLSRTMGAQAGRTGTTSIMGALAGVAGGGESDMVRAIPYPSLKQVTVIASPENMKKIALQIAEWDKPLDVEKVKPLIIEVKNSDPIQMADFLNRLFSSSQGTSAMTGMMFGTTGRTGTTASTQQMQYASAVIGPLYGKLTFEAVPDAKKIVVISQIPVALEAIKQFVEDLDRQETAELPEVVILKYADPEDLCERLNAMLCRDGTSAPYRLTTSTLSSYGSGSTSVADVGQVEAQDTYQPWWGGGGSATATEQPISTLIGKVRFIPDSRSKAIMFLAPLEYLDEVTAWIEKLDKPSRQVVIKAVIMEVSKEEMTALGVQFSSDPTVFSGMGESALYDLSTLLYSDTINLVNFTTSLNVSTLVDFLIRNTDAKILNQPSVWAKDNEEATFFSGGTIPFIAGTTSGGSQIVPTNTYEQLNVGVTLRVKPKITPEEDVDMTVNLIISQEGPQILNNTSTNETNTTTHMIVQNGNTILLSGYLYQKDSDIVRKLPLLGDIPLLGGLFRHKETEKTNKELLIFITPQVVELDGKGKVAEDNLLAVKKLDEVKAEMDAWMLKK